MQALKDLGGSATPKEAREKIIENVLVNTFKQEMNRMADVLWHYACNAVPIDNFDILDVEKADGISKAQLQEDVLKWLVEIERVYKVRPIIYTGLKFKRQYLDRSEFDEYPLWIANYADSLSYDGEWEFWQYSDAGKVDGISEYVDLDVYHTTLESFESLLIHK